MIKNLLLALTLAAAGTAVAQQPASVTIKADADSIMYFTVGIDDYVAQDYDEQEIVESAALTNGSVTLTMPGEPVYMLSSLTRNPIFVLPGETIVIDLTGDKPAVSGSRLAEQMLTYAAERAALQDILREKGMIESVYNSWRTYPDSLLPSNLDTPFGVFLVSQATVAAADKYIDQLTPEARESFLAPLYQKEKTTIDLTRERAANAKRIKEGVEAPDFTLTSIDGKQVSLKSLRGKWVLLDFWGAWCKWCMVGVPQMKAEYAKWSDKCEFVGIDCGDTQETWLTTVEEKQMNWLQLYAPGNTRNNAVTVLYGISGFPTKLLIDANGIIRKVCIGEDPEFYSDFSTLLND